MDHPSNFPSQYALPSPVWHQTALFFDPVGLLSWIHSGKAPRKGSGTQGMCLVQTMVTHEDGSALLLLLLLLSGCSRCGSALLPLYSLLPCFRGFIPAWLVRASEDRLHLAGGHSPAEQPPPSHAPGRAAASDRALELSFVCAVSGITVPLQSQGWEQMGEKKNVYF